MAIETVSGGGSGLLWFSVAGAAISYGIGLAAIPGRWSVSDHLMVGAVASLAPLIAIVIFVLEVLL